MTITDTDRKLARERLALALARAASPSAQEAPAASPATERPDAVVTLLGVVDDALSRLAAPSPSRETRDAPPDCECGHPYLAHVRVHLGGCIGRPGGPCGPDCRDECGDGKCDCREYDPRWAYMENDDTVDPAVACVCPEGFHVGAEPPPDGCGAARSPSVGGDAAPSPVDSGALGAGDGGGHNGSEEG